MHVPRQNPDLIDVFIVILMAGAIDIFIFSMATQLVDIPVFKTLPSFITDAYTAVWTSAVAGAAGIGGAIVKALTRQPGTQTPNYIVYVFLTALTAFIAILAVAYASRAVLAPPQSNAALEKCTRSVQAGQYDIALERCAEAANKTPNSYAAVLNLGYAQYYSGQYEQAILSYKRALQAPDAEKAIVLYNIAFTQESSGDHRGAVETLKKALEATPSNSVIGGRILILKAKIQEDISIDKPEDNGLFDDAVQSYKAFLEIGNPKHWAHLGLACLYAVKAAHSSAPEVVTQYEKRAANDFDLALTELRQLNPDTLRASEILGLRQEFVAASQSKCAPPLSNALAHQGQPPLAEKLAGLAP